MTCLAELLHVHRADPDPVLVRSPSDELRISHVLGLKDSTPSDLVGAPRNVALSFRSPLEFVRRLIALDGRVDRLVLLAPDLPLETLSVLMDKAGAEVLLSDRDDVASKAMGERRDVVPARPEAPIETTWLMTTSGTTGVPKIAPHSLRSLSRSVRRRDIGPSPSEGTGSKWGLLYDPSRFAGLQVVLQALLSGGELLAPAGDLALSDRVRFLADAGCSHLSGTPSLWRKLLMMPETDRLDLWQVTLGGETADDGVLTALKGRFPNANITHIYASTEIGVAFSVKDGRAGFPASYLDAPLAHVSLKIVDDQLWIRPVASSDKGVPAHVTVDGEGYICTQDRVAIEGGRVVFLGRESSLVNVGGTKVNLEDVEQVVRSHPGVGDCHCSTKPNPILGAVITLSVVPNDASVDRQQFQTSVKGWCRERLPREAQPATVRVVEAIDLNVAGKLSRGISR